MPISNILFSEKNMWIGWKSILFTRKIDNVKEYLLRIYCFIIYLYYLFTLLRTSSSCHIYY